MIIIYRYLNTLTNYDESEYRGNLRTKYICAGGCFLKKSIIKNLTDTLFFTAAAVIYSVAVNVFLTPNEISPGGFTGIATVINYVTHIPTGTLLLLFNIPLLVLGYIKTGKSFIIKTSFVTVLFSAFLDLFSKILPPFKTEGILASVFGGILMGVALSIVMLHGATTGGIDIIAKLINGKYRHLSIGKVILTADVIVVIINALVYKNAETALYSITAIYASTRIIDLLLYGADKGKIIYIVTANPDLICREINQKIGRGVTKLSVKGGYTGENRVMLMCIVRVHEAAAVHAVIKEYDDNAFIVVSDAGEIIGEGFKNSF